MNDNDWPMPFARIAQAVAKLQRLHDQTVADLRLELAEERARRLKAETRALELSGVVVLAEYRGEVNERLRQEGKPPLPNVDLVKPIELVPNCGTELIRNAIAGAPTSEPCPSWDGASCALGDDGKACWCWETAEAVLACLRNHDRSADEPHPSA